MTDARTIVFFPEGAYGPTNNCVGIGQVLRARGHRVVFIVEESFAGTLEVKGFEERLMRLGPPPAEPEVPGQFWIDFIRDTAPVFRKSTLEQLGEFIAPTWQALIDGSKYVNPRLAEIFDELAPDVIVEDNVVAFPAITASGRPWVRIVSCNPMELKDAPIAPFSSGLPGRRPEWLAGVPRRGAPNARRHVAGLRCVLPRERRDGSRRTATSGRSSSPSRRTSTSTPTRPRPTTSARSRSARRGTASTRRCARPRRPGSCRRSWPSGKGR